jgi:hypothetical protein
LLCWFACWDAVVTLLRATSINKPSMVGHHSILVAILILNLVSMLVLQFFVRVFILLVLA